jgi:predicted nucleic acid-binding protein
LAKRTYIDSCVLLYAAQGTSEPAGRALPFLFDPEREYVTSDYVRLELVPHATYNKRFEEVAFYEAFFKTAIRHIPTSKRLLDMAMDLGCKTGVTGIDAIHVACAIFAGAEELVTAERSTKPIYKTTSVKVVSINPPESLQQ